jgi:hypothetical protein
MTAKVGGYCLGLFALLAAIILLLFTLDRASAPFFWNSRLVALLNLIAIVSSLRVAYPWPESRSALSIRNSARCAVVSDVLVAAIIGPWAVVYGAKLGLGALLVGLSPFFLLAPVLWHFGFGVLRFWKPTPPERH